MHVWSVLRVHAAPNMTCYHIGYVDATIIAIPVAMMYTKFGCIMRASCH